jgi:hypothetical protein
MEWFIRGISNSSYTLTGVNFTNIWVTNITTGGTLCIENIYSLVIWESIFNNSGLAWQGGAVYIRLVCSGLLVSYCTYTIAYLHTNTLDDRTL